RITVTCCAWATLTLCALAPMRKDAPPRTATAATAATITFHERAGIAASAGDAHRTRSVTRPLSGDRRAPLLGSKGARLRGRDVAVRPGRDRCCTEHRPDH